MGIGEIIVIVLCLAIVAGSVATAVVRKKHGKGCCDCANCKHCSGCGKAKR